MTAFGEQMRGLMAERGMSLRRLAKTVNYDVGYLSKVRNGIKPPSPALAAGLDRALVELVDPGVMSCSRWRPGLDPSGLAAEVDEFCGLARKPGSPR